MNNERLHLIRVFREYYDEYYELGSVINSIAFPNFCESVVRCELGYPVDGGVCLKYNKEELQDLIDMENL